MKFLRHFPPFVACIVSVASVFYSFYIPWCHALLFQSIGVALPVDFGLFNCFGPVCQRLDQLSSVKYARFGRHLSTENTKMNLADIGSIPDTQPDTQPDGLHGDI